MRFYGKVGFANSQETAPGVWKEIITEYDYYGDVIRDSRRLEPGQLVTNDTIVLGNQFSVIGDEYAYGNIDSMRYVSWMGKNWVISSVEFRRPRLILSIGGIWNGDTP